MTAAMMRPGPRNLITDVAGLYVGQAADARLASGVSVVVGDAPFVAAVHAMGGAPGTRETDLLEPDKSAEAVDALVLSGGSAFGLAAADGVMAELRAAGRGYAVGTVRVPLVPAAILFDMLNGGDKAWTENPYPALGAAACRAAASDFALGTEGAGTGATTATLKGGLGSASVVLPSGATVGAIVAVNALGNATVGDGPHFWAAPFEIGAEFGGLGLPPAAPPGWPVTKLGPASNTTIAVVATDAVLTKAEAKRMAVAAHDGIARALVPAHTPMDGDLVFTAATGRHPGAAPLVEVCHGAATCLARAIARGVHAATARDGDLLPTWAASFGDGAGQRPGTG